KRIGIDVAHAKSTRSFLQILLRRAHLIIADAACQPASRTPCSHPRDQAGTEATLTAWQATPSISAGASRRQRSKTSGQRGLKAQPGGGSIGLGISPLTGIRWRPDIARSGTAPRMPYTKMLLGAVPSSIFV